MPSVIALLNQDHEITNLYSMNIVGRQTIIVFDDEQKLDEIHAAVSRWAAQDDLIAATMALRAETVDDAERLLITMSPGLAGTRFVPDTDPVVDELLAHIRDG
jgi:hypothetical protein